MEQPGSKRINITIPAGLLAELDALCGRDYASRSDIIRQVLLEHIRKPENNLQKQAETRSKLEELNKAELDRIRAKYPRTDPDDIELLMILVEYEQQHGQPAE